MKASLKNDILRSLATQLAHKRASILAANRVDLDRCSQDDPVLYDRLKLDDAKIDGMIAAVEGIVGIDDPQGQILFTCERTDGLRIENRRVPFGTVLIIFEARPDVCIEAGATAVKAGNRILLKGGKEARETNLLLTRLWHEAIAENAADADLVRYLDLTRDETQRLIAGEAEHFDLVIPRGGEGLIDFALRNSRAPVLVSGRGNNFLYIDGEADLEMAARIAIDGKSRLSVCNALDKVLISKDLPGLAAGVRMLAERFAALEIEVYGDNEAIAAAGSIIWPIDTEDMWYEEFLAPKIVFGVADDVEDAISKINKYSGGHSAAIVTGNENTAREFLERVDCAAVFHNASTRFTDGGEFGLGAEIAISTQKLHARGPLGVEHLLTNKWFIHGDGQVRG